MSLKPLPRKQRVENRGYQYSRKDKDRTKDISVTLEDIDSAIFFYFDIVILVFSVLINFSFTN